MSEAGTKTAAERLAAVRSALAAAARACGRDPASVRLVGVTKSGTEAQLADLQRAGLADLAENRVQQLLPRATASVARAAAEGLPAPTWHMIGHLQTNKVKPLVGVVDWVHSIDSEHLAAEINRRAGQHSPARVLHGLIEVNVSGEASKHGVRPDDVAGLLRAIGDLPHLRIVGLMTMAPYAEPDRVRAVAEPVFAGLRALRDRLAAAADLPRLPELSMGMSGDFAVAIEHGATLVRIGTRLFE